MSKKTAAKLLNRSTPHGTGKSSPSDQVRSVIHSLQHHDTSKPMMHDPHTTKFEGYKIGTGEFKPRMGHPGRKS